MVQLCRDLVGLQSFSMPTNEILGRLRPLWQLQIWQIVVDRAEDFGRLVELRDRLIGRPLVHRPRTCRVLLRHKNAPDMAAQVCFRFDSCSIRIKTDLCE